ncbi:dystrobrevin beta-like isoform X4 [Lineus longissimus]|uniref:dystrobrevin beta-like isoform X4 n=1 Tax=Lineus longissimus TaxID=88925 RepID=UPI00315D638E
MFNAHALEARDNNSRIAFSRTMGLDDSRSVYGRGSFGNVASKEASAKCYAARKVAKDNKPSPLATTSKYSPKDGKKKKIGLMGKSASVDSAESAASSKAKKKFGHQGKSKSVDTGTALAVNLSTSAAPAVTVSQLTKVRKKLALTGKSASVDSSTLASLSSSHTDTTSSGSSRSGIIVRPRQERIHSIGGCLGCWPRKGHLSTMEDPNRGVDDNHGSGSNPARPMAEHKQMMTEMRAQNFDVIRFATYRTACKLRFIQKKINLHLVDIWNVIEAFRENGFNTLEPNIDVNVTRVESLLSSIFCQLNKRLPNTQQINIDYSINLLLNWLLYCYDKESRGKVRVLSVKVALSTLCAGKLMDKLRYVFTQVSDTNGFLVRQKFEDYLKDILALPSAVYEGPSFGYSESASRSCFDGRSKVTVNDFLDTLMSEPGPQCLMWLPILHRMSAVENVFHPIQCEGCHRESFMGFRYKCQRCYNYHLCQDCFWRGRTSGNHSNEHEMKEYSSYSAKSQADPEIDNQQSPSKQLGHSIRKSFRCVPAKPPNNRIPHFPETPEKTIDLSNIVPPTPVPVHNGIHEGGSYTHSQDLSSQDSGSATKSPSKMQSLDCNKVEDEHRLIARYAARLAADTTNACPTTVTVASTPSTSSEPRYNPKRVQIDARSPTELNFSLESSKAQRELISQLEQKNRDIMHEIQRLRIEQESTSRHSMEVQRNPTLLAELRLLRQRKDELEGRMSSLQDSRRELMVQLEGLMKLLKNHGSPRSTPGSSPRSRSGQSPTIPAGRGVSSGSSPSTPGERDSMSMSGFGSDMRQAFNQTQTGSMRSLRNDLLVAADSVTNAMSSLVKELNSEASSEEEDENGGNGGSNRGKNGRAYQWKQATMYFEMECDNVLENQTAGTLGTTVSSDLSGWKEEMEKRFGDDQKFIAELRARKEKDLDLGNENYIDRNIDVMQTSSYTNRTDEESVLTDAESYVRTDDDESYNFRTDEEDAELYDKDPKELLKYHRYTTDDESCLETDAESYIRTDDEDGGNTDWEENMRRWVNR